MSETWVSREELAEAIGDDGADLLCRAVGGVSTYIPRKPVAGSPLSAVIGPERMERLCAAFGGLRVTLPNRRKGRSRTGSSACWKPGSRRDASPSNSA